MGESSGDWCLIESDPGVFTELIKNFGCEGVQVEEMLDLSKEGCSSLLSPIHGFIFLFKWQPETNANEKVVRDAPGIFFARQVIQNACATQAIISILLNSGFSGLKLGDDLKNLKEFCEAFDPLMKGTVLSNSENIKNVHNSFAQQQVFDFESPKDKEKGDAFHFISILPINGRLYELDGLKEGPIDHGKVSGDWTDMARDLIQEKITRIQNIKAGETKETEIRFNLMAVISDKKQIFTDELEKLKAQMAGGMETDGASQRILELEDLIKVENDKMVKYREENQRRKHNYIPFIIALLQEMAQKGQLIEAYQQAKSRVQPKPPTGVPSNPNK